MLAVGSPLHTKITWPKGQVGPHNGQRGEGLELPNTNLAECGPGQMERHAGQAFNMVELDTLGNNRIDGPVVIVVVSAFQAIPAGLQLPEPDQRFLIFREGVDPGLHRPVVARSNQDGKVRRDISPGHSKRGRLRDGHRPAGHRAYQRKGQQVDPVGPTHLGRQHRQVEPHRRQFTGVGVVGLGRLPGELKPAVTAGGPDQVIVVVTAGVAAVPTGQPEMRLQLHADPVERSGIRVLDSFALVLPENVQLRMDASEKRFVTGQPVSQQNFSPDHVQVLGLPAVEISQARIPPAACPVEPLVTEVNRCRKDPGRFSVSRTNSRRGPGPRPVGQQFHRAGIP